MIKVLHIITGLETGGAEMMLYKLVSHLDRARFDVRVISLIDIGPIGMRIQELGIPVQALGMARGTLDPVKVLIMIKYIQQYRPHIVQTWMYHAEFLGGLAAKLVGGLPVVWNIRNGHLSSSESKRSTLWVMSICARLSSWLPTYIISCSEEAISIHGALGYDTKKMTVIPNGFALNTFKPDSEARTILRRELSVPDDTFLIGLVARFDPQKDHRTFLRAAALLQERFPYVHFILCGDNICQDNRQLVEWIEENRIAHCCHLLGRRNDTAFINAALDIASLSSAYGEAFPNVIGEAMACGIPCVVTNVGDSAAIVGDTGKVVQPRDPKALAEAWELLLLSGSSVRECLGKKARQRVTDFFNLPDIVMKYQEIWSSLLTH